MAKLGELTEKKPEGGEQVRLLLEISDAAGKRWHSLGIPSWVEGEVSRASLSRTNNDISALPGALFLGIWLGDGTAWWWIEDVDAPDPSWKPLGTALPPHKFPAGEIDSGLRDAEGRKLMLQGGAGGVVVYTR